MSNFDDRVRRLIEDRVNDLERLFLTSENRQSGVEPDCCEDIARKVNHINEVVGDTNNVIKSLQQLYYQDNSIHFGDIFRPDPEGDPEYDPADDGIDHEGSTNLPGWLESGIPPTLKDILDLLAQALGGSIIIRSFPQFAKWLFRHLPDVMTLRTILPLFTLLATLWRGLGDRVDANREHLDTMVLQGDLQKLTQKVDDIARLLAEVAATGSSGGDTSILIDRLQDILDDLTAYYQILAGLGREAIDLENEHYTGLMDFLQLIRGDTVVTDSSIDCIAQWIKGQRSCEQQTTDVITLLEGARECCNYVKCHLDEYYQSIIDDLSTKYNDLRDRMNTMTQYILECKQYLTEPHNPIERIEDSVERGNVVGTGSLVLNYANDLNIIKSMLVDIRRLL